MCVWSIPVKGLQDPWHLCLLEQWAGKFPQIRTRERKVHQRSKLQKWPRTRIFQMYLEIIKRRGPCFSWKGTDMFGSGDQTPLWLLSLLSEQCWTSHLNSACLSFLICESKGSCRLKWIPHLFPVLWISDGLNFRRPETSSYQSLQNPTYDIR